MGLGPAPGLGRSVPVIGETFSITSSCSELGDTFHLLILGRLSTAECYKGPSRLLFHNPLMDGSGTAEAFAR